LVSLFTYLSWNCFAWALLIISARYFAILWSKSYIFSSLSFENCMCNTVSPMCLLSSDKQPKMKYFISLFYSNLKCLNIRLLILFEHRYYIFIELVLEKDLFQTRVWFQKKPPVWHFTATYIGVHNVLATNPLFSQQKQKEFQLKFLPDEYSKVFISFWRLSVLLIAK
jgi:hypothetical protein